MSRHGARYKQPPASALRPMPIQMPDAPGPRRLYPSSSRERFWLLAVAVVAGAAAVVAIFAAGFVSGVASVAHG